ncbi:CD225/dispanin family protein [Haloferula sargassicola]|uniref:GYF domain-containing protein n=1 Tax=Haloferula sargassicola TaxID=490096 RepID=A0ABP9US07_9BACT
MSEWYFAKGTDRHGPVSQEALLEMVRSGQVGTADLVWKEGMEGWEPVSKVPLLAAAALAQAPATSPPPPMAPVSPYQTPAAPSYTSTPGVTENIPTYLWQSIVVTLLCCLPFGIVAIVFASRVSSLKYRGDAAGAREASDKAKFWVNVSVISGIVINVIFFVIGMFTNEPVPQ